MKFFMYLREITFFSALISHTCIWVTTQKNYECVEICVKGTKAFQGIVLPQFSQKFYQVSLEFHKTFDTIAVIRMKMSFG